MMPNNAFSHEKDSPRYLHELVEAQTAKTPSAIAVIDQKRQISYSELNRRAGQLACFLQKTGVRPNSVVAILEDRTVGEIISILGVLKAGAAYLPLDPQNAAERNQLILNDSRAELLLTRSHLTAHILTNKSIQTLLLDEIEEQVFRGDTTLSLTMEELDLAYVMYTSGSTGLPKGVAMRHTVLVNLLRWQQEKTTLGTPARTLQFAPSGFDVSCQEIFSTLGQGGTLVMISDAQRRDPLRFLTLLKSERIERLFLPFIALQHLAQIALAQTDSDLFPDSLKDIVTAGEQLQITPPIRAFFERLGRCRLHNQYGPTETHVVTAHTLGPAIKDWETQPPIGLPIDNAEIYILDAALNPTPAGSAGELYIGGAVLARGYLHRPELTAERFLLNPFKQAPGERIYKTGDRVRTRANGELEFLGRLDSQVKIRGYRIEPGEVENAISQSPLIKENAVIVHEDVTGEKRLVAYVVPKDESTFSKNDLIQFLRRKLPEYMLPSAFVIMQTLPLTASGKVNRLALSLPEKPTRERDETYAAPTTQVEKTLTEIWSDVLGLGSVGIHDDFFIIGGHSLAATQAISRIHDAFQINLPINIIFDIKTIAELGKLVETILQAHQTEKVVFAEGDDEREEGAI